MEYMANIAEQTIVHLEDNSLLSRLVFLNGNIWQIFLPDIAILFVSSEDLKKGGRNES